MGVQTPRIWVVPEAKSSAGQDAIDLAAACGLVLDPWQQLCLHESLKESDELVELDNGDMVAKWASFAFGLVVSRQNGKGSILEALALAGLILFGERLIIHSAHEFKTAVNAMERLETLIANSGLKYKAKQAHGAESIEILDGPNPGARIFFQTRTDRSGIGLTADRLILDEAMHITPGSLKALLPTVSARPNPQVIYTGTAADQRSHPHCGTFGGVRYRALEQQRTGERNRLCFLEWSAPDDLDPKKFGERRYWAMANPGLGYRQTEDKIADEYQEMLANLRDFGVDRLGVGDWPAFGEGRSEIPRDRWSALIDPEPNLVGRPVVSIYRAPEGGPWTIAAAWRTEKDEDGAKLSRIHLEVGYSGSDPADMVMKYFLDVVALWDPVAIVVGRGAASDHLPDLQAIGVEPVTPSLMDEAKACGSLLNDVFAAGIPVISHGNDPRLASATTNAIKADLPSGGFVWSKDVDDESYSQLMAITLARWAVIAHGAPEADPAIHTWPTPDEIEGWLNESDEEDEEIDTFSVY